MSLAKNLNNKKSPKRPGLPKLKNKFLLVVILGAILVGSFGAYNLVKVIKVGKKQELKYESTGDRPLQQKLILWVSSDKGLYLREEPSTKGTILKLIPNGTQLESSETKDDWYKVTYLEKTGWIKKEFTTTQAPAEDPKKDWNNYKNTKFGYSLRFPKEWVVQDYGENPASGSTSYIAFGLQLPAALDPLSLPPVIVRVSGKPRAEIDAFYKGFSGTVSEQATVSAIPGVKYTFNSAAGTQMTAFVVTKGSSTFVLEESGGFSDELLGIVNSLNLP